MSGPDPDELVVSYTVKDILADIRKDQATGFARIEEVIKSKADKGDIARINGRLDEHQKQIADLRTRQDRDDEQTRTRTEIRVQRRDWHRWLYPTLAAIGLTLVAFLQGTGALRP